MDLSAREARLDEKFAIYRRGKWYSQENGWMDVGGACACHHSYCTKDN